MTDMEKRAIQQIIFTNEEIVEKMDELIYGPVKVIKGKYKGRIGYYDDDDDNFAYVYWGSMVSVLDTGVRMRKSYISNQITTYDLVERGLFLQNTIAQLRC